VKICKKKKKKKIGSKIGRNQQKESADAMFTDSVKIGTDPVIGRPLVTTWMFI
jgi:hypothetical protein